MSLEPFRRPRLIVLHPNTTAYEAAHAMVDNHVGALLVMEGKSIVGIITDRDLASEVVAAGLDPHETLLEDIMTAEMATVSMGASIADVVLMMRQHACRRIPILEDGKPVGLVTLDDLLLEGVIDAQTAAEIIRSQLEVAARYKREGAVHPEAQARLRAMPRGARAVTRRTARAEASYHRLLRLVERQTGLQQPGRAELALKVVLGSICRRLTPAQAKRFVAQLPSMLQAGLGEHFRGPDRSITRDSIENELSAVLDVDLDRAEELLERISEAITESVTEGQIDLLRGHLPHEMKGLFPAMQIFKRS